MWWSIFDTATGEILRYKQGAIQRAEILEGEEIVAGYYDARDYLVSYDAETEVVSVVAKPQGDQDAWRLDEAKREAQRAAASAFLRFEAALVSGVPEGERLSWSAKAAAARRFRAGNADGTGTGDATTEDLAMLDAERAVTGETRLELTDQIIGRADAYGAAAGLLAGVRRTVLAGIEAATTVAEVDTALAGLSALDP